MWTTLASASRFVYRFTKCLVQTTAFILAIGAAVVIAAMAMGGSAILFFIKEIWIDMKKGA